MKAGGTPGGGYFTPFQGTRLALIDVVRRSPGIPLRDALQKIEHHYRKDATAFACLSHLIQLGKVRGLRAERGKALCLFIEEATMNNLTERCKPNRIEDPVRIDIDGDSDT